MPKSGGNWLREVLKPITINDFGHRLPSSDFYRPHIYLFVRNPWQWYSSLYHYLIYGSEIYNPADDAIEPLLRVIGHTPSFDEFVEIVCFPTPLFKKKLKILTTSSDSKTADSTVIDAWLENNVSLYHVTSSCFISAATNIGTTENIASDLRHMLIESGDLTPEIDHLLTTTQHKNVENCLVDYRTLYTDHLRSVVAETSKSLIERFKYTF